MYINYLRVETEMTTYILLIAILSFLIFLIVIYNRLVSAKNLVNEAFSGIDVQLQKRFELIPSIIQVVKGYNKHEAETLMKIVSQRNPSGREVVEAAENDKIVTNKLSHFKINIENYPDLKSSQQFLNLMDNLSKVENELAMSRRYYNGTARAFNTLIQVFPNHLFAPVFGFKTVEFYSFEGKDRNAPKVEIN